MERRLHSTDERGDFKAEAARRNAQSLIKTSIDDLPQEIYDKKYKDAPTVGIALKVISISHLDMADNTFMADFNVNIAWKGEKDWVGRETKSSAPIIQIYNQIEGADPDVGDVKKGDCGFDYYVRIRYNGKFRQHYNLRDFPFDEQKLSVRVRLKSECKLVHLPWGPNKEACSVDYDAIEDDFRLEEAYIEHQYHPSFKFGELAGYDPEALVVFLVQRKADYWVYNYGLMVSVICTFCFAAFCLPVNDMGDRLGIGFTLNLTIVATFYLMQDKLPPVPYWTELDKHMVTCIAFTMLVMLVNCLPAFLGEDFTNKIERSILFVLAALWTAYHFYQAKHIVTLLQQRLKEEEHKRGCGAKNVDGSLKKVE